MLRALVASQATSRQNHADMQELLQTLARTGATHKENLRDIVEQRKLQASLSDSPSVDEAIQKLTEAGFRTGSN